MRKTKIICTMGPATDNDDVLRKLILAGMDAARLNFSHGSHEEALERVERIKRVREQLDAPVAIILDTKGPEIRIKTFKNGSATLVNGNRFTLYTYDVEGDDSGVSITYKNLPQDISEGAKLLIDDGLIELEAVDVEPDKIECIVRNGGMVYNSKGVNVPNVSLNMPYMSKKDKDDLLFGIEQGVDFVAASFARDERDIMRMRSFLDNNGGKNIRIIAKIENYEGVKNIEKIIEVSHGVMVARGDMGVEIPLEDVPVYQKEIIKKTYTAGKIVITATQMLESMIRNPRPTRAETTDVANAIYDGTSAIMLSGETAIGKYPVETVKTMSTIAKRTERDIDYLKRFSKNQDNLEENDVTNAISHAACTTAHDLNATAIIALTFGGKTAQMLSKFRPACPIIAATTNKQSRRQLNLSWGVVPIMNEIRSNTDALFEHAVDCARDLSYLGDGDLVVITGGAPVGMSGTTNIMRVHIVGNEDIIYKSK